MINQEAVIEKENTAEACGEKVYECTARNCRFKGLPKEVRELCKECIVFKIDKNVLIMYSREEWDKVIRRLEDENISADVKRALFAGCELIENERCLFFAIYHACKRDNPNLSQDPVFSLRLVVSNDKVIINVTDISEPSAQNERIED